MRAGEEYAELSELAPPPPSTAGVGGPPPGGGGGARWAEEALLDGGGGVPVGSTVAGGRQGRSSGYYSPPGTSYTIVERPGSGLRQHRDTAAGAGYGSPRGKYVDIVWEMGSPHLT
nr:unnamed protein product [Callosobruchus analis]